MSVQKRIRGGKTRWVARYRDATGREHSKTFDTRREAAAWASKQENAIRAGEWINPAGAETPLREVMESYVAAAQRPNTKSGRLYAMKSLGDLLDQPLRALTPSVIEGWVGSLTSDHGLAPATVESYLLKLRTALYRAVRDGLIMSNPARGVRPPRGESPAVDMRMVPTPAEVQRFIQGLDADKPVIGLIVRVIAATGLRAGEVSGLTVGCLDAAARCIQVSHQTDAAGNLAPLKTPSSQRRIQLDDDTFSRLIAHARTVAADQGGRLFYTGSGLPMTRARLHRVIADWAKSRGFPDYMRPHALRHFHATELLRAGVPIKTVQARLGHASASMTLEVYAHAVPGDDMLAAETIARVLNRECGPAAVPQENL